MLFFRISYQVCMCIYDYEYSLEVPFCQREEKKTDAWYSVGGRRSVLSMVPSTTSTEYLLTTSLSVEVDTNGHALHLFASWVCRNINTQQYRTPTSTHITC